MKKFIIILTCLFGGFYCATLQEMRFLCDKVKLINIIYNPMSSGKIKYEKKEYLDLVGTIRFNYYINLNGILFLSHKKSYERWERFYEYHIEPKTLLIVNNRAILL